MKITILITILITFALGLISAPSVSAYSSYYCTSGCYNPDKVVFTAQTLYGGDHSIIYDGSAAAQGVYEWPIGETVDFSLEYNPETSELTYTVDGKTLVVTVDGDDNFKELYILGQSSVYGGNGISFTGMSIDGNLLPDLNILIGTKGLKVILEQKYFSLNGKVVINVKANTNSELAGMKILILEGDVKSGKSHRSVSSGSSSGDSFDITTDEGYEEVPEFGVVTAGVALIGAIAGFVILRNREE